MTDPALQAVPTPAPSSAPKQKFSLARADELAKFWVGLAGAVVATVIQYVPNVPHWLITVDVFVTAAGVFIAKNAKAPNLTGEGFNGGQMTGMSAATDGVGDPAHPASIDLPDVAAAPDASAQPLPPLDLSGVAPVTPPADPSQPTS